MSGGHLVTSALLHSDELPDISELLSVECVLQRIASPLAPPYRPHQSTAQTLDYSTQQVFGCPGMSPQTKANLSQPTHLWSESALLGVSNQAAVSCRLETPVPTLSTAGHFAPLRQYGIQHEGGYPTIQYGHTSFAASVAGANNTTAAGNSRLIAANDAAVVKEPDQQALSHLLGANSADAVLSIATGYPHTALRSSSSLTSANTAQSQVSMSLDALLKMLEHETTVQQQQQQEPIPVAATVFFGATPYDSDANLFSSNLASANNRVASDDFLSSAQLCDLLAAAAAATTPADGVSEYGAHSMRSVNDVCTERDHKRLRLSDSVAAASNSQTDASDVASCFSVMPHTAPRTSQQQQQPATTVTASYQRQALHALAAQDVTVAVAGGAMPRAGSGFQPFTAPARSSATDSPYVPAAANLLAGRLHFLLPENSDTSLLKSLFELQARGSAQSALRGKKQNAAARLLARQQQRCKNCTRALYQAVKESLDVLASDTPGAAVSGCDSF